MNIGSKLLKVFVVLLIIGASYFIVQIIKEYLDMNIEVTEQIDEGTSIIDETNATLIIKQVENAYSSAYISKSSYPTLQEVKNHFNCSGALWKEDLVIESGNFNCTVEVINNNLKVTCLYKTTNNDLILSS